MSETHRARTFHGVLDQKLADHGGRNFDRKDEDQDSHMCWNHSCSSIFATGLATIARPRITIAMPHQRWGEICSPRNIQQLSGMSTCTTFESGKAIESGMYLRT